MADVVVVGAGLGGLAVAARLAKLGHLVVVYERSSVAGGAIRSVERDGYRWDAGPASMTLPAVVRDLFRKSGRPIERSLALEARDVARRHVFTDGAVVDLPTGSRARQTAAVEAGLGGGTGAAWTEFVDTQSGVWETLRARVLDEPNGGLALSDASVAKVLRARLSLDKLLRKSFKDERLRTMAAHSAVLSGSAPRDVPAYCAVETYVERSFGVWDVVGGMARLADALVARLDERGVTVHYDTDIARILHDSEGVSAVETVSGELHRADVIVTDVDPRVVFGRLLSPSWSSAARRRFETATPAIPVSVTHVGLEGDVPALPEEVVVHGDPLLVVTTTGDAPAGHHAWTLWRRGGGGEDVLVSLARRGIDVRNQVSARVHRTAGDLLNETGGSPYGLAWSGYRSHARRARFTESLAGLHLVGAGMHGGSIPYVGWGAAHVATRIGKA